MRYIHSFLFLIYESSGEKEEEAQGRFVIVILVLPYYHYHYHQLKGKCKEEKKTTIGEGSPRISTHKKNEKYLLESVFLSFFFISFRK